jgi:RHS repeat-associated protein
MTDPNGKITTYTHDALNRLETRTEPNGNKYTYAYDAVGNMISMKDAKGNTTNYTYDSMNRLTKVTHPDNSTVSHVYDYNGNRTSMTDGIGTSLYQYDALNRLTSYTDAYGKTVSYGYDSNGNLTSRGSDGFSYDYRDKLTQSIISGTTVQYKYDGAGNRLARIEGGVTKRYVQDVNSNLPNVIAETDGSGNITAYYVYGLGLVSMIKSDGATYYYHFDSRGSAIALTDTSQNVTDQYAYDPFGKATNSTGSTVQPFKYVGRYGLMDEGNGLTYIRARYYSPELGRFITKDPLTGKENDSQSLNRYIYAVNNPVGLVDVSGFDALDTIDLVVRNACDPIGVAEIAGGIASIPVKGPIIAAGYVSGCVGVNIGFFIGDTIWNTDKETNLRKPARELASAAKTGTQKAIAASKYGFKEAKNFSRTVFITPANKYLKIHPLPLDGGGSRWG